MPAGPIRLTRDNVVYAIDASLPPRLTVTAPIEVVIETHDARGGRLRRPEDVVTTAPDYRDRFPRTNPATGPIAIAGAEPGDTLVIDVLDIDLDEHGYILAKPDFGVLRDIIERPVARMCSVADGHVQVCGIRLPVRPMIGVLATAPSGEPRGTAYVGSYGGNMDCGLIAPGARVRLPVQVPGALFFVGDVHASMGDGEVNGSGVEFGARVTLKLGLEKQSGLEWPTVETADTFACLASAPEFYDAAEIAVRNMVDVLAKEFRMEPVDAYMLVSAGGDLRLNQACRSPIEVSVRVEFPRNLMAGSQSAQRAPQSFG
jgi:amidase